LRLRFVRPDRSPSTLRRGESAGKNQPALILILSVWAVTVNTHRKRPENIKEQLEVLTQYAAIDEVLVWHANADTVFTFEHPKVCM
jgi:hypothetical protein